jgi:hypothetical protein
MNNDPWTALFVLGFVIGTAAGSFGTYLAVLENPNLKNSTQKEMISECELHLPRTEKCELIAVPVQSKEDTTNE